MIVALGWVLLSHQLLWIYHAYLKAWVRFIFSLPRIHHLQASYDTCLVPIDELINGSISATLNLWLMVEISRRQPNSSLDLMAQLEADPGDDDEP